MPSFSIDDLRKSVFGSASDAHQIVKNPRPVRGEVVGELRREKRRLRSESEQLIRDFLAGQKNAVLFLDICDHLQRRPSPLLRQIVSDMVTSGELIQEVDYGAGPLIARHLYRVNR